MKDKKKMPPKLLAEFKKKTTKKKAPKMTRAQALAKARKKLRK